MEIDERTVRALRRFAVNHFNEYGNFDVAEAIVRSTVALGEPVEPDLAEKILDALRAMEEAGWELHQERLEELRGVLQGATA